MCLCRRLSGARGASALRPERSQPYGRRDDGRPEAASLAATTPTTAHSVQRSLSSSTSWWRRHCRTLFAEAALRRRFLVWRLRARDHLAERTLTRIFRFRGYGVSAQPQLLTTKTLSIFVKLDATRRFARQLSLIHISEPTRPY